jgi:hypothetical protein
MVVHFPERRRFFPLSNATPKQPGSSAGLFSFGTSLNGLSFLGRGGERDGGPSALPDCPELGPFAPAERNQERGSRGPGRYGPFSYRVIFRWAALVFVPLI